MNSCRAAFNIILRPRSINTDKTTLKATNVIKYNNRRSAINSHADVTDEVIELLSNGTCAARSQALNTALYLQKRDDLDPTDLELDRPQYGLFTSTPIYAYQYILEYGGAIYTIDEWNKYCKPEENEYTYRALDPTIDSDSEEDIDDITLFYIDATQERAEYNLARYINHSSTDANIRSYVIQDKNLNYHVCFFALHDIEPQTELLVNYDGAYKNGESDKKRFKKKRFKK